jgi:hypothetical protein
LKPTNATFKNQWAPASSTRTKRYGNGQTAGQIAMNAGVAGSAMLYGPGNSQPHKYACGRHFVDVHALKAHHGAACTQTGAQSSTSAAQSLTQQKQQQQQQQSLQSQTQNQASTSAATSVFTTTVSTQSSAVGANHGAAVSQVATGATPGASGPASGAAPHGGVLGTGSSGKAATSGESGGVLGALTTVGHGTLPFTGFPIWAAAAAGLAFLVLGGMLARRARATA